MPIRDGPGKSQLGPAGRVFASHRDGRQVVAQPRGMHPPPPGLGVQDGRREDGSRPVQVETDVADRRAGSRKSHTPNVRGCPVPSWGRPVLVAWHWLW